jgi:hypothetical protein
VALKSSRLSEPSCHCQRHAVPDTTTCGATQEVNPSQCLDRYTFHLWNSILFYIYPYRAVRRLYNTAGCEAWAEGVCHPESLPLQVKHNKINCPILISPVVTALQTTRAQKVARASKPNVSGFQRDYSSHPGTAKHTHYSTVAKPPPLRRK